MRVPGWIRLRVVLASTLIALAAAVLGTFRLITGRVALRSTLVAVALAILAMPNG